VSAAVAAPPLHDTNAAPEPLSPAVWRLCGIVAFGAFMSGLDASVVNVGLDTIGRDLGSELGSTQWVANGFLLALAVSLPACGWAGRRVGPGRLWLGALTAFTMASGLCALAPTVHWLIALRAVQGLAAGLLIPAGQTILGQAVGPERLGRVMATLGIAVTVAPAIGPSVGGLIVDRASWPWLFLINVPVGALALALGHRVVPRGSVDRTAQLDRTGLLLLTLGVPAAVLACTAASDAGGILRPAVMAPLVLAVAALAAYVRHARRPDRRPVLDLGLYRNRVYAAATATTALASASMFGAAILFPLYFQLGRDRSVVATGLLLIPLSIGTALALPLAGRLVDRVGGGLVSLVGAAAALVTTAPFTVLDLDAATPLVLALLLVRGMAIALAVVPLTAAAYKAVSPDQLPDATTQVNISARVGGALGGTIFTVVLAGRLDAGTEGAFHTTFAWLTAASLLGVAGAAWLAVTERSRSAVADLHISEPATEATATRRSQDR
jgi:EmrB/QacA subfamily drug resistance transporter